MQVITERCDTCGQDKPPRPRQAKTWWVLQDVGALGRTGPLHFCSLPCIADFVADDEVRKLYVADFVAPARTVLGDRYDAIRWFKRWRWFRWLLQLHVVRVD
jgi:hypothetical protein